MIRFSKHQFNADDWHNNRMPFTPEDYSLLKFGDDEVAQRFGHELADAFFEKHSDTLLARPTVVIPSPFNYVENAATILTRHLIHRLNHLLVNANGEHVDYSTIHRKVSYTGDYGFMSAEQRTSLLSQDEFFLNERFYRDKNLVFVDDVRITGTHERRLEGILETLDLGSAVPIYVYYSVMDGECIPEIEGALNLASINSLDDYLKMAHKPNHHVIVRPLKFLLSQPTEIFSRFIIQTPPHVLTKIYYGCLGEGYYRIPNYQNNFSILRDIVKQT